MQCANVAIAAIIASTTSYFPEHLPTHCDIFHLKTCMKDCWGTNTCIIMCIYVAMICWCKHALMFAEMFHKYWQQYLHTYWSQYICNNLAHRVWTRQSVRVQKCKCQIKDQYQYLWTIIGHHWTVENHCIGGAEPMGISSHKWRWPHWPTMDASIMHLLTI